MEQLRQYYIGEVPDGASMGSLQRPTGMTAIDFG